MKVVLAIIGVCTLLIATAMVKDLFWPARQPAPLSPSIAESNRQDRLQREEKERKDRIYLKAYEECKDTKVSADAISRCILAKTN